MRGQFTVYLAKVVDHYHEEDTIDVVFLRGSHSALKVKVLHDRANPLYGTSGNLPDIGEVGLVMGVFDYGQEFFWLGSYHDSCDNTCTNTPSELGRSLFHHESDVYHQILPDGTVEFSHPSGTFFKLGSTGTLNDRKRFRRVEGKYSQRIAESYPNRQSNPINLTLTHTWLNGSSSEKTYETDARKKKVTGDFKSTTLSMDTTGNVVLDHETDTGTHMKLSIDKKGDVTVYSDHITLRGISGDTQVDIIGRLHATDYIVSDTDVVGNMVYDANGLKSMLGMRNAYNPHIHGTSPAPNIAM